MEKVPQGTTAVCRSVLPSLRDSLSCCPRYPALKYWAIFAMGRQCGPRSIHQRRRGEENLALHRAPVAVEQEERIPLDGRMHHAGIRAAPVAPRHALLRAGTRQRDHRLPRVRRGPQRERDVAPALPRHRRAAHLVHLPRRIAQADARRAALPVAMHPDAKRPQIRLHLAWVWHVRLGWFRDDAQRFPAFGELIFDPPTRRARWRWTNGGLAIVQSLHARNLGIAVRDYFQV